MEYHSEKGSEVSAWLQEISVWVGIWLVGWLLVDVTYGNVPVAVYASFPLILVVGYTLSVFIEFTLNVFMALLRAAIRNMFIRTK